MHGVWWATRGGVQMRGETDRIDDTRADLILTAMMPVNSWTLCR